MSVDPDYAIEHLNLEDDPSAAIELQLYVDAANEWLESKVTDTTPSRVILAGLFLIEHWWNSQRGPASNPLGDGDFAVVGSSFAIPNRVLELIDDYLISNSSSTPTGSFPDSVAWPDSVETAI